MFSAEITGQDATAWIVAVGVILGGVWTLLRVTIGAHLKEQDKKLESIEALAHTANREATTVRDELREHMRRAEVAFAAPWWRRHRSQRW